MFHILIVKASEDTGDTLYDYDPKQINSHTIKYEGAAAVRLVKN